MMCNANKKPTRKQDMMKEKANLVWCAAKLVVKNTVDEEKEATFAAATAW
jgi:hypothetical protein